MRFSFARFLVLLVLVIAVLEGGTDARRLRGRVSSRRPLARGKLPPQPKTKVSRVVVPTNQAGKTVKVCDSATNCNGIALDDSSIDCQDDKTCSSTSFKGLNAQILCNGIESCISATNNADGQEITCKKDSCRDLRVNKNVDLTCHLNACAQMTVQAASRATILCESEDSCDDAKIVKNVALTCEGSESCKSLQVDDKGDVVIWCTGDTSCNGLSLPQGGSTVHIECVDRNSCTNSPVCEEGQYGFDPAAGTCHNCPAGSTSRTSNRGIGSAETRCECPADMVMHQNECVCPVGHYGNAATGCTSCATHKQCEAKDTVTTPGTGSGKIRCTCKWALKFWETIGCLRSDCNK